MKYFLLEYLDLNNPNLSIEERKTKDRQWETACIEYNDYITANKNLFSKSFLKEYFDGGFHDYKIKRMESEFTNGQKLNFFLELESKNNRFFLISKNVIKYSISVDNQEKYMLNGYYTYGEYYIDDNGFWHHNFLFGNGNESNIISKKFIFKKG